MKFFYLSLLLFCSTLHTSAQFSGAYSPANWSTILSAASNGSVNTSAAPASITVNGSNDASNPNLQTPVTTDYTITASTSGIWKFTWTYHSNDDEPQYDPAGILVNGVFIQLTNNAGGVDQTGTYTAQSVTAGTVIGFRVWSTDNSHGNATLTISDFKAPGTVLPVTLISFTAKPQAQTVQLQWKTADERNLAGFTIERSTDGVQFGAIATVPARNTPNQQTYEATDAAPLAGTTYYRLRIREQTGEDKISAVATVRRTGNFSLQVYPNPVKDRLTLTVDADRQEESRLEVADAGGRVLYTKLYSLQAGRQTLTLDHLPFAKGIYYIRFLGKVIPIVKD